MKIMMMDVKDEKILSAWAVGPGGTAEAVAKMCMGNRIGYVGSQLGSGQGFGGFVVETPEELSGLDTDAELLGRTTPEYELNTHAFTVPMEHIQRSWETTLEPVYPCLTEQTGKAEAFTYGKGIAIKARQRLATPEFVIPVLLLIPGL